MPELPEVETTLRGIQPKILHQVIQGITIRHTQLRWPVTPKIKSKTLNQVIQAVERRGKYLLLRLKNGTLLIHLGMSGKLRILPKDTPAQKHDHIDLIFSHDILRFTDPRRFGAFLWVEGDPSQHMLLKRLGVEPLTTAFNGRYLKQQAQRRVLAVKLFIMDNQVVVGVGNIYANEALFLAKIHPQTSVSSLDLAECNRLARAIKQVLRSAIRAGGTTLRDFSDSQGNPGYFSQDLQVYGRQNLPCFNCARPLALIKLGQRATVFCPSCQVITASPPSYSKAVHVRNAKSNISN
ncbi:MAG: bifunctional DNA-formamidopyrimidine glycosylase/DNA-(apurinic or apyrimidinic site) lyase [Gammaproteobacteria bacterium]